MDFTEAVVNGYIFSYIFPEKERKYYNGSFSGNGERISKPIR